MVFLDQRMGLCSASVRRFGSGAVIKTIIQLLCGNRSIETRLITSEDECRVSSDE
jgi:hypothetical protein